MHAKRRESRSFTWAALLAVCAILTAGCSASTNTLDLGSGDSAPSAAADNEPDVSPVESGADVEPAPSVESTRDEEPGLDRPDGPEARPVHEGGFDSVGDWNAALASALGANNIGDHMRTLAPNYPSYLEFPDDAVLVGLLLGERASAFGSNLPGSLNTRVLYLTGASPEDLADFYGATLASAGLGVVFEPGTTVGEDGSIRTQLVFQPDDGDDLVGVIDFEFEFDGERTLVTVGAWWEEELFARGLATPFEELPVPESVELAGAFLSVNKLKDDVGYTDFKTVIQAVYSPLESEVLDPADLTAATIEGLPIGEWESVGEPGAIDDDDGIFTTEILNTSFPGPVFLKADPEAEWPYRAAAELTFEVAPFGLPALADVDTTDPLAEIDTSTAGTLPFTGRQIDPLDADEMRTAAGIELAAAFAIGATNAIDHVTAFEPNFDAGTPMPDDAVLVELVVFGGERNSDGVFRSNVTVGAFSAASLDDIEALYSASFAALGYEQTREAATITAEDGTLGRSLVFGFHERSDGLQSDASVTILHRDEYRTVEVSQTILAPEPFAGPRAGWVEAAPRPNDWTLDSAYLAITRHDAYASEYTVFKSATFKGPGGSSTVELANQTADQLPVGDFEDLRGPVRVDGAWAGFDAGHAEFGEVNFSFPQGQLEISAITRGESLVDTGNAAPDRPEGPAASAVYDGELATIGDWQRGFTQALGANNIDEHLQQLVPSHPDLVGVPDDAVLVGLELKERPKSFGELPGLLDLDLDYITAMTPDQLEQRYADLLVAGGLEVENVETSASVDGSITKQMWARTDFQLGYTDAFIVMRFVDGLTTVTVQLSWEEELFASGLSSILGGLPVAEVMELDDITILVRRDFSDEFYTDFELDVRWTYRPKTDDVALAEEVLAVTLDALPAGDWQYREDPEEVSVTGSGRSQRTRITNATFRGDIYLRALSAGEDSLVDISGTTEIVVEPIGLPVAGDAVADPLGGIDTSSTGQLPIEGFERATVPQAEMRTAEGLERAAKGIVGATNVMDHVAAFDPSFDLEFPLPQDAVLVSLRIDEENPIATGVDELSSFTLTSVGVVSAASLDDLEDFYLARATALGYEQTGEVQTVTDGEGNLVRSIFFQETQRGDVEIRASVSISSVDNYRLIESAQFITRADAFPGPVSGWLEDAPQPDGWVLAEAVLAVGPDRFTDGGYSLFISGGYAGPHSGATPLELLTDAFSQLPRGGFLTVDREPSEYSSDTSAGAAGFVEHDVFGSISIGSAIFASSENRASLDFTVVIDF